MGPRVGLDAVAKGKTSLHFPSRESMPGRPDRSLVTILTELLLPLTNCFTFIIIKLFFIRIIFTYFLNVLRVLWFTALGGAIFKKILSAIRCFKKKFPQTPNLNLKNSLRTFIIRHFEDCCILLV
jgi:hypothetical protein